MKVKFKSNNMLPVDKTVNIHLATVIIRSISAQDGKYYRKLYLDDGLYESWKMLEYVKLDISEGIDNDMSNKSKECMLCHYWYF